MNAPDLKATTSFEVRGTRSGVVDARERVVETAREWEADVDVDELRLTTSETITNALRHGSGPIRVVVEWLGSRLRVEVEDRHPVRPLRREPDPYDTHGRGLQVVSGMAERWGTLVTGAAKSVWFEIPARGGDESDQAAG